MNRSVCLTRGRQLRRFALLLSTVVLSSTTAFSAEWIQAHAGKAYNLSGMALLSHREGSTEFVVVHDNKKNDEPRLGIVTATADRVAYRTIPWPTASNLPIDLESITTVPGRPGLFLTLCSEGRLIALTIEGDKIIVRSEFMLPDLPPEASFEGFSVQQLGDQLLAVWGQRGAGSERGILFWGILELEMQRVSNVSRMEIIVPFPKPSDPNTRHIAELKVDSNGIVWGVATNDPGDAGPFVSAVYTLGILHPENSPLIPFEPNTQLTRLWTTSRKIEAMEFVPGPRGAIALGTDDENDGGWLYFESKDNVPVNAATAAAGSQ